MHKIKALLFTVLLGSVLYGCSGGQGSGSGKNLLLICIDTVRADTFFALNAIGDDTLAAWQERAMVFTNAQAPSPWTVPSVGSVFTGRWPSHHGAGLFDGPYGNVVKMLPSAMPKTVPTITAHARDAGLETVALSASGWTSDRRTSRGLMRGFDKIIDFDMAAEKANWRPIVDRWREEFLPGSGRSGFYHYLHLMDAHEWHMAEGQAFEDLYDAVPESQRAQYRAIAPRRACEGGAEDPMCKRFIVYAAAVRSTRNGIASALDTLEREGLLDNTIVVAFSDHGEEFLDHYGDRRKGSDSLLDYMEAFGHGRTMYSEQLRVPLLVWHPEHEARSIGSVTSLLDIAPSLAHWLQLDFPSGQIQGVLLDHYLEENSTQTADRIMYGSAIGNGEQQLSALHGTDKAIWYIVSDHIDYYDLATDPGELNPISSDQLVMKFDGLLMEYVQSSPDHAVEGAQLTSEQIRRLQSIGYLQGIDSNKVKEDK
jgi:arylsulfatase A-like enzyme